MLKFDQATHQYEWDGKRLVSVTEVLQGVGLVNFDGINRDILERAAAFGTAVHQACHLDDIGDLDEQSLDPALIPHLEAWRAFRGDLKFDAIEQPLCHPDYGLAGTPDRITHLVKPTILDIKTSSIVPPWVAIQLVGYAILADLPAARRLAVQLKGDGTYRVYEFTDRKDRGVFLAALSVYQWRRNHNGTSV